MAEAIVTGLMEALVTGLLEKSGSLIADGAWPELKSFLFLDKEVQKLESTLGDIQAVLEDAEKRQVEAAVKRWLDKLKEAAYDIDNVLDELETAMIKSKIQEEEEEAETTTATAKVWSCISCLSGLFVKLKELVHRRGIAHKIKKLNEKLDEIAKGRVAYGFQLGSISNEVVERPRTTSFVDVSHIIGRKDHRDDLVSNLLGKGREIKRNPYVISIVGMGGIGKTTLAQLAYNDPEVQTHFEKTMWVCVSHPFNPYRVAKAIIEAIEKKGGGSNNFNELEGLHSKIRELIEGKKFLLVLDDMWTENFINDWEPLSLALKNGAQGSSILVTARNVRVASTVHSDQTIRLELLSMEDCLSMFNKIAFADKNENQCKQLTDLAEKLANKCKGLPLAAKILGSLMQNKTTRQEWEDILENNLWNLENVQEGILGPLLLSYNEQPSAIKSCFLYCALFPKDCRFYRNELIYLWMAQGYLGIKPNIEMEIVGEKYFERLVMHSFFQDFERDKDNDKIISCKMHDIVHDFAQSRTNNEYVTIDGDKELGTNCKSAHHLRFKLMEKTQFPMSMYNAKNVRTLFFTLPRQAAIFPLDLSKHLTCLRVLTLKDTNVKKLPNEVEKFIHLRLLDLSNNDKIEELPETMCNL
nr:putative disease resistance protein RGA3 [Quercus suber]XP_023921829.1 putative disease resistance protein RGA3 [Quercus suber]XP_023921830.1 putative disease resistance protein RGA3 [Quercus suber]XP_023921831.1 putative disease resistance protein RGA3 [Quercus suber]XP_023921832.1 putative disease resistance protein RGA3 [Quercus suber]XP_023921833.1 putative disease resistance protein RGA3 [Quercus suber]XP_023921834.1 putative disease resistance protein RGA3 [Quercus suber]XP_02392183